MSKKTAKDYAGADIREVWDFRLSNASPHLHNSGETWVIRIMCNHGGGCLEEIVTDIPAGGDMSPEAIQAGQAACYPILYDLRDKYSRDHIEKRKPVVRLINQANNEISALNALALESEAEGDAAGAHAARGEMAATLAQRNREIKAAAAALHAEIQQGGSQ